MISPSEPRRTMRKRRSAIGALANIREQITRRVSLGIADDGDADTEARGRAALRDRLGRVVGSLGVDVGTEILQERFDVRFGENDDEIHGSERGDKSGAATLG